MVEPQIGPNDDCFDGYPELSIEDWHKNTGCGSNDGIKTNDRRPLTAQISL